jgi:chromosome segregation ATPase
MHDDMNISERLIGGIESFWTAFANKFRFDNSKDNRRAQAKAEDEAERAMSEDDSMVAIAKHDADMEEARRQLKVMNERSAGRKTGISEVDDYFEETDRDLDDVFEAISEVKRNSLRMRASMVRDDKLLDRLHPEAARLEERIRKSNAKIDRIVK